MYYKLVINQQLAANYTVYCKLNFAYLIHAHVVYCQLSKVYD